MTKDITKEMFFGLCKTYLDFQGYDYLEYVFADVSWGSRLDISYILLLYLQKYEPVKIKGPHFSDPENHFVMLTNRCVIIPTSKNDITNLNRFYHFLYESQNEHMCTLRNHIIKYALADDKVTGRKRHHGLIKP